MIFVLGPRCAPTGMLAIWFLIFLWIKAHVHDKKGSSVNLLSRILLGILLSSIHSQWTNCTNDLTEQLQKPFCLQCELKYFCWWLKCVQSLHLFLMFDIHGICPTGEWMVWRQAWLPTRVRRLCLVQEGVKPPGTSPTGQWHVGHAFGWWKYTSSHITWFRND